MALRPIYMKLLINSLIQPKNVTTGLKNKLITNKNNSLSVNKLSFSTTSKANAIPPLVWLIAKPVTKLGAIIAGRYIIILILIYS
jgi:hypothetical protein